MRPPEFPDEEVIIIYLFGIIRYQLLSHMKVFIYITQMWYCHPAFYGEIISNHIENGDDIEIVKCNKCLQPICKIFDKASTDYYSDNRAGCDICMHHFDKMIERLDFSRQKIHYFTIMNHNANEIETNQFQNTEELLSFEYKGNDIGSWVANTFITSLKDIEIDTKLFHYDILSMLQTTNNLFNYFLNYLQTNQPDLIYLFNGRWASQRAVLKACQNLQITCNSFEYGSTPDRYTIFENTYPQDIEWWTKHTINEWEIASSEKHEIGKSFFEHRRFRTGFSYSSYTQHQELGTLPKSFNPSKRNIAIFDSSMFEFRAVPAYYSPLIPDGNFYKVISQILEHFLPYIDFKFYLRVHPHLTGLNTTQIYQLTALSGLNYSNLEIIWPDSRIDTYQLMGSCEKVLTSGSTTGVEATYWGKPSIMIGSCIYKNLDVVYNPQTLQDTVALIKQKNLKVKPLNNAIMYGFFQKTYGTFFKHFDPIKNTYHGEHWDITNRYLNSLKSLTVKILKEPCYIIYRMYSILNKVLFFKTHFSIKNKNNRNEENIFNKKRKSLDKSSKKQIQDYIDKSLNQNSFPLFRWIEMETMNRCNNDCPFCPVNKKEDTREYSKMGEPLFNSIIEQLAAMNYSGFFALSSNNEPLLDNRIFDFLKIAREKLPLAFHILYTNGTLLTVEKYKKLIPFLDKLLIDNYNDDKMLNPSVKEIFNFCVINPQYQYKTEISMRKKNEVLTSRAGQAKNRTNIIKIKSSCALPFYEMTIRPDGKVSLCCNDALGQMTLGDINQDKLIDIWRGESYTKIRKLLSAKGRDRLNLCKKCDNLDTVESYQDYFMNHTNWNKKSF